MYIVLIRHLPTDWNKKGLLQGKRDVPIDPIAPNVWKQIHENKKILNEIGPFDIVLTSTLKRTQQTAAAYGFTDYAREALLDELDFGTFEGRQKRQLIEKFQLEWFEHPRHLVFGESLADFENRIFAFLDKYASYHKILAFGHGSWIRAVTSIHQIENVNKMNQIVVDNNALIQLDFNNHRLGGTIIGK
ncbi:histidine phosphatase family protein [Bacillus alveayuensis]|jgi:broad specificity phosphatase PhoE|uniref:histidine phosphatase family protein n=1 Tax=Aeribacillus alveayuensis TaxID=279215 RepID=UPI0005CCD1E6|nr:phosphoglycerate mutase family protein [Bacillus alveayuensis]